MKNKKALAIYKFCGGENLQNILLKIERSSDPKESSVVLEYGLLKFYCVPPEWDKEEIEPNFYWELSENLFSQDDEQIDNIYDYLNLEDLKDLHEGSCQCPPTSDCICGEDYDPRFSIN